MTAVPGRLRLTVLGCSTALPHPDAPAAGFLVESGETAILLDVGHGVVRIGSVASRTRGSWRASSSGTCTPTISSTSPGSGTCSRGPVRGSSRLPVHLPPGGRGRLDDLASAISERAGFFDDAYAIDEYDPDAAADRRSVAVRFAAGRHYVPAWGVSVEAPDGARLVYTGDTGPSDAMVEFARGADVLLVEATLRPRRRTTRSVAT